MTAALVAILVAAAAAAAGMGFRHRVGAARRAVAIDPFALTEPWRRHVSAAQSAQRRYRELVAATPAGPLRANMDAINRQVDHAVEECWLIARRGAELDTALRRLDTTSLQASLQLATDDTTKASLESQLQSATRIRATRDDTDQQLRLMNTRMGELVAQAAEVSVGAHSTAELGSGVEDVVTKLEGLRLALEEVNRADPSDGQVPPAT